MAETAEVVQEPVETQKIYDMTKGEFVDIPVEKKEVKEEAVEPEEEEQEEQEIETEDEQEEDEPESVSPDDFIKATFEEKFDVKSQEELESLIENAADLMEEHESLKTEVEGLRKQELKFANDEEKNAYNFIKKFGVPRQGEAFQTYADLIAMDVENIDPKLALEKQYILQNPELTREEAQKRFNRDYKRKYIVNKEEWTGSDADFDDEVEMRKIDLKSDYAKSKKFLKKEQDKYKPTDKDNKPVVPEPVQKSIEKNAGSYQEFLDDQQEIVFEENGEKFNFKLDKDMKKAISQAMMSWVKNPASYDEKGKIVGVEKPEQMFRQITAALYSEDMIKAVISQVKNSVSIKRVEEIAQRKPDARKSVGDGAVKKGNDLYDSARELIKKKA